MDLLERDAQQEVLQDALQQARSGRGCIALVSGEAGVGKTSLIASFISQAHLAGNTFWGSCDPLFTPRPLGPVYDIALQKLPGLFDLLNSGANWLAVVLALLKSLLENPATTIIVFEDIHWADEATLDLLKYLGRRIEQTHSLLILTYRDDEVGSQAVLSQLVGNLPAGVTIHMPLKPLSEQAVGLLAAKADRSAVGIYQATLGNPFFVTEVLRSKDDSIPKTVRDAVLARAAHLSAAARGVLELASIILGPVQISQLDSILKPEPAAIDACVRGGFLVPSEHGLSFRHELARLAISEAIPFSQSKNLHQKVLQALLRRTGAVPLALLVHHAVGAADEKRILEYAPLAAQEASQHGAHREAARHYQTALNYSSLLTPESHARLLDGLSFECYLTGQIDRAIRLREEAVQQWRRDKQDVRVGDGLRWLSRLYWFQGNKLPADRFAAEAIDVLEKLPPGRELAMAYSNRSQLFMLAEENELAIDWGNRALTLAETINDQEIIIHALTNIGMSRLLSGDRTGLATLEHALALAIDNSMDDHVARCYANLSTGAVLQHDYQTGGKYLSQGIAYTTDRDMDSYSVYLRGWNARMHFEQGKWTEAVEEAEEVLRLSPGSAVIALPAVTTLGYVKMRRGDPDASIWLDQARDLALPTGELQRIGPVAAARAEAAWWDGDRERVLEEVAQAYALAQKANDAWQLGLGAFWRWRAGGISDVELDAIRHLVPVGYMAMMGGEPQVAAAEWERIGCPYERALALTAGSIEHKMEALHIFEQLGARPAERALRAQLHQQGIKGIPRGPRPSTKGNPAGLTARELEILGLLAGGYSNAEIASRLTISLKTVDHHVSTILAKLDVHSRLEAASAARQKNLLPPIK